MAGHQLAWQSHNSSGHQEDQSTLEYLSSLQNQDLQFFAAIADPFTSRLGVLSIILCIALGIANLLHLSILILFGAICLQVSSIFSHYVGGLTHDLSSFSGLMLIFVEIPLLLRICPTSSTFDNFIRRFTTNAMRAAIYATLSLIQWLSLIKDATSLIAAAVILLLAATCYAIAALKKQTFVGSKTLGGQGVAQMIV